MSRRVLYQDDRLTLVGGTDVALGTFYQLFDRDKENETPEGEGLIFDWSYVFGIEINLTGIAENEDTSYLDIIDTYIENYKRIKKIT